MKKHSVKSPRPHQSKEAPNYLDAQSFTKEERKNLATLIINLFEKWELDTATKLNLLGLSSNGHALTSYRKGSIPISNNRDQLDRIGWLLAIHKTLRLLYPQNLRLRYHWVHYKNKALNNQMPLELMQEQGIIGIAKVARYLDYRRGR